MPLSTVSVVLEPPRGRQARPARARAAVRYERSRPGELVHIDVKKLGRIEGGAGKRVADGTPRYRRHAARRGRQPRGTIGWEYVHVAVDDYSRLAYAEVLPDEKARHRRRASSAARSPTTAATASRRARPHRQRHRLRLAVHALACRARHPPPPHPTPTARRPTAKPNASSAPCINGWAYGAIYRSSHERTAALDGWLWHYNHRRRHSALGHQPPVSRTNLLGSYT